MTKILLDVMHEDLAMLFPNLEWTVETVSNKLGVTQKDRDDGKVLQYAKKNSMIVITADKKLINRLKANSVRVVTVDAVDKARVIHEKVVNGSA